MRNRYPSSPEPFEDEEWSAQHSVGDDDVMNLDLESDNASDRIEAIGKPWSEWAGERESGEGAVEREGEPAEYPHARIVPEIGQASRVSEATEETWTEQQESSDAAVDVRILWPALGFPAVIAPREQNARGNIPGDATRCICLLVLANRTLSRDDVARNLRYVTWDNRRQRHLPEGTSPGTFFPAADITVRMDVKSDPISLSTPGNRLISLVGFGGGKGENSAIIGGIAKEVLTFYSKMQILKPLTHLQEIRISEDASNRLVDGRYHLFWNNAATKDDVPSDEMQLLIEHHAQPLRERDFEPAGVKDLLKEYEFEYGPTPRPYLQAYSRPMMMRGLPRTEVLHPVFVQRKQAEPLRIGHLTDLHVDVRADVYEANLEAAMNFAPSTDEVAAFNKAWETLRQKHAKERSPTPWKNKADREELAKLSGLNEELVLSIAATQKLKKHWYKGSYNNLNRSFRDNYTKARAESDILLLTGDLIDYGRGHFGVTERRRLGDNIAYNEDRNWFLFHWLLAGDNSYTVPSYTILGNHDWRINPYPPFAIDGAPSPKSILNNYWEFVPEFQNWLLQIAHGPGYERAFSYASTAVGPRDLVDKDPWAALSTAVRLLGGTSRMNIKGAPTETNVASVKWYLLTINPFLDYAFPHPSGQKLLMLDWAEAEDVLFDIVERGKARPYGLTEAARASDPGPKAGDAITPTQQKMVDIFLARPGPSKLVGIHAPPIAPWYDWYDNELVKSRKLFPGSTVASRRHELGTFQTPEDCRKGDGRWIEADQQCVEKVPRGPDIVSVLPNGEKKRWNGHPFFAIRPPNAFEGMTADYGSIVRGRDKFIKDLIEPGHGVRAVFSGHNHRDGLHTLWRMGPESGPQTNGTLRVRLLPGRVTSIKPGSILGPLWVNTTSAGFRGHHVPSPGKDEYVPPGRAQVWVRRDGTIDVAEFRRLPGIDKRTALESILDEIEFDRVSSGEFETSEAPRPEGGWQLASSLDDQLADLAERVMSTPASGPERARDLKAGGALVALMEEDRMVEKPIQPAHEASISDKLEVLETEDRTGRRVFPGEPVTWLGKMELGKADYPEGADGGKLDPVLMDLAERVMSSGAALAQETTTWTRCFAAADIENVLTAYADNAAAVASDTGDRCSCIVMLNVALGRFLPLQLKQNRARGTSDRRVQMAALTTESIEQAMQQLREKGFATAPLTLDFLDNRNRTAGTLKPLRLKSSLRDEVLKLSESDGCWYAYGMSIMDGYHSVLLLVDHGPTTPKIYWLDQFSSGLDVDVTDTLDQRVTDKTQAWWQSVMDTKGKGYSTMLRAWPLRKPRSP
jgi:3',5'-cyclic AMP phosphodiesterase CpdA